MPPKVNDTNDKISKAGITTSESGDRVIASSTRADGSVRKEIRVRPGYRPPEDVEVYKNRTAEAFKKRGTGGVPGAEALESNKKESLSQTSNKNAKRKEARKKAAANVAEGQEKTSEEDKDTKGEPPVETEATEEAKELEVDREKEAKKLTKKLRQARELKDKKDKGDALLPEQFEKVIRINELIRQLDQLGFGPDGEKKESDSVTDDAD